MINQDMTCSICGKPSTAVPHMNAHVCGNTHEKEELHYEKGLWKVYFRDRIVWVPGDDVQRWYDAENELSLAETKIPPPTPEPKETKNSIIDTTLNERASRYGKFEDLSKTAQEFKAYLHLLAQSNPNLKPHHMESLEMILHKIARILNGDPDYIDNWHDIAGYATLVEKILKGEGV